MIEPEETKPAEIEAGEPDAQEPEPELPELIDHPCEIPSITRCLHAAQRAYHSKLDELELGDDDDDFEAREALRLAYLRAMPPLVGHENVREFIACVTFAELAELIRHSEAEHYLQAAKVALGALRCEPQIHRPAARPPTQNARTRKKFGAVLDN